MTPLAARVLLDLGATGGDWLALLPVALVALCCGLPLLFLLVAGRHDKPPDGP
jgi:hypothetical protein